MQFIRFFSTDAYKGSRNYLRSQSIYEGVRTLVLFMISGSLYLAGYIQTGSNANLLTIVAVLGFLPACKGMVNFIMFMKSKGCPEEASQSIDSVKEDLSVLYDLIFTSDKNTYTVYSLCVRGKTIGGYTEDPKFDEQAFKNHLTDLLKLDGHKDLSIKIFTDLTKYTDRLSQMKALEPEPELTESIISSVKNIIL